MSAAEGEAPRQDGDGQHGDASVCTALARAWIARLWPNGDLPTGAQVHAVVDAARDPRIFDLLATTGLEQCCLFAGPLSRELRMAAPHLVHLAPQARFTREFFALGAGQAWGSLIVAPPDVTLPVLRRHLRTLLRVCDEQGRLLMFRFYDPRVLRVYLPSCRPGEAARFFGPVQTWLCEAADGAVLAFQRPASSSTRQTSPSSVA